MAKILFFDDEKDPTYLILLCLEENGHEVSHVDRLDDNLVRQINLNSYDLLLLDIKGKGSDEEGITFAEMVRRDGYEMPIIFSSASSVGSINKLQERIGMIVNSYTLMRPHSEEALLYEINRLLGGR